MSTPPSPSPPSVNAFSLGYTIAIALSFLLLLATLLIASYLCRRRRAPNPQFPTSSSEIVNSVVLPSNFWIVDDENPNSTGIVGLDHSIINSYPKLQFSRSEFDSESEARVCSICLCDYKEGEMLRMMPDCRHAFHLLCLDAWLRLNGSCPVCRNSPLPTPVATPTSTPLAEVVPLAQFGDNRRRGYEHS